MAKVVIVGAGVVGTFHAWVALARGHEVVHLERDPVPRGASFRNFGLIWVSGRAAGTELEAALRARNVWEEVSRQVPDMLFSPRGSLTVARTPPEVEVLEAAALQSDATERGFRMVDAAEARSMNPALQGPMAAALWCERDACVEPRQAVQALGRHLATIDDYHFRPGAEVVSLDGTTPIDNSGRRFPGDVLIICPGAERGGVMAALVDGAPLQKTFLHMMEAEADSPPVTTAVADGDSLRYYPAFAGLAANLLPPQEEPWASFAMQLLMRQRANGALVIGDTHLHAEPFPIDLEDRVYEELKRRAEEILGVAITIRRRWTGIYSKLSTDGLCHREEVVPGVWVVTGAGGRGHTLAPAFAAETADLAGL